MLKAVDSRRIPGPVDVFIVGGGINGASIARDLAGRGLSVVLAERDDLAQHTSSSSTKLIHGGLRYLEYYEFGLVRKALKEREVLLRQAPHIMWPLRFIMPHDPLDKSLRPSWMIRAGLFLYDNLAKRHLLPASRGVNLTKHVAGAPLKARFTYGYEYSDGWVDDARLVVLNAMDARDNGARVLTQTRCEKAWRILCSDGTPVWEVHLRHADGSLEVVQARALVNAAGPWAASFLQEQAGQKTQRTLRLVKGSHIVVKRLFAHEHAYIFQNDDKRIIFAIPYERDFTLIGTTDIEITGDPGKARIDQGEIDYLCRQINHYFSREISAKDVVWSYSGVRPLLEDDAADAAAVTRDYKLEIDAPVGSAPLLTVWGGKITTSRCLAEEASDSLTKALGERSKDQRNAWTSTAMLPGGDLSSLMKVSDNPHEDVKKFSAALSTNFPQVSVDTVSRWARSYGALAMHLLNHRKLGEQIAPGLFEAEIQYLIDHEFVLRADDLLWRRSKLGLHYTADQRAAVARYFETRSPLNRSALPSQLVK
jgi:glycerol-3-phosphate dehydrogenase